MGKKLNLKQKRSIVGLLFISPWLIGFLLFYVRSLVMTIGFSLADMEVTGTGYTQNFNGFDNYIEIFTAHGSFKKIFTESLGNIVIDVPLIIFFSLFMAILLNKKFKGRALVRAIFFLPVILNSNAIMGAMDGVRSLMSGGISAISSEMADASGGMVNIEYYIDLFEQFGMPSTVLGYLIGAVARISSIVTASGVQIVLFIAALQSIAPSMYEVAKIEGATGYETFWKVTFPMVTPHIITNVVYTVVDSFVNSEIVELAYKTGLGKDMNYGLSAAMTVVSASVICLLLVIVCRFISKRAFYYN